MSIEAKLKDRENTLSYENVTLEELRKSNYPDNRSYSIWVNFSSKTGCNYNAVHVPSESHIRLSSEDKNRSDLADVARIIIKELGYYGGHYVSERGSDIMMDIYVPKERLTQGGVAGMIELIYKPNFQDVWISNLYYYYITRKEFENSTLPKFKIVDINHEIIRLNYLKIYKNEIKYFLNNPDKVMYHNVNCKLTNDEIKTRQIPDIKIYLCNLEFYASDNSRCKVQLGDWDATSGGDFRILIHGPTKYINPAVKLISSMTGSKHDVKKARGESDSVPIFLNKGWDGQVRQQNILDLMEHLRGLDFHGFSCSVTYKGLTKDEFDKVVHKSSLDISYVLAKNRKLRLEEFIGDLDPKSLFSLCTNASAFEYYFEFLDSERKKGMIRLAIINCNKLNPDIIVWVNKTQRDLIEHMAVTGVVEK